MPDAYGNIIPTRFVMRFLPLSYEQEIFVNWLEVEIPAKVPLLGLEELRGWRNREVYAFIKDWDWTSDMFPKPVLHEYERPSIAFVRLHAPRSRRHVPLMPMRWSA